MGALRSIRREICESLHGQRYGSGGMKNRNSGHLGPSLARKIAQPAISRNDPPMNHRGGFRNKVNAALNYEMAKEAAARGEKLDIDIFHGLGD